MAELEARLRELEELQSSSELPDRSSAPSWKPRRQRPGPARPAPQSLDLGLGRREAALEDQRRIIESQSAGPRAQTSGTFTWVTGRAQVLSSKI